MKKHLGVLLLLMLTLTIAGCGGGGGSSSVVTDDQQINRLLDQCESAVKAKDAKKLAGMISYPIEIGGETYINGGQVAETLNMMFEYVDRIHECELRGRTWTIDSNGSRAIVKGELDFQITVSGETLLDRLPITLVLRNVGNRWMISSNAT